MFMARPKPILDYILIEKLANLGCTEYEIAYAIGYTPRHFSAMKKTDRQLREAIDRGSNGIKISIRRAQLKVALPDDDKKYGGNPTMLIWLGKQYLHQSDRLKLGGDEDNPIQIKGKVNVSIDNILTEYYGPENSSREDHTTDDIPESVHSAQTDQKAV